MAHNDDASDALEAYAKRCADEERAMFRAMNERGRADHERDKAIVLLAQRSGWLHLERVRWIASTSR